MVLRYYLQLQKTWLFFAWLLIGGLPGFYLRRVIGVAGLSFSFLMKETNQNKQTKHAKRDRETRAVLRISIWCYALSEKNNRLLVF